MPKRISSEVPFDIRQIEHNSIIRINGVINSDVEGHSYQYNREFGAAVLNLTLNNQDGIYSPDGTNPIKMGDIIELEEGIKVSGS